MTILNCWMWCPLTGSIIWVALVDHKCFPPTDIIVIVGVCSSCDSRTCLVNVVLHFLCLLAFQRECAVLGDDLYDPYESIHSSSSTLTLWTLSWRSLRPMRSSTLQPSALLGRDIADIVCGCVSLRYCYAFALFNIDMLFLYKQNFKPLWLLKELWG